MLTGRAAELRPDVNELKPSRIPVEIETTPAWASPGEYVELTRQSIRIFNRRRAEQHRARQVGRTIPTSGPGRRRAKAIRNREA